MESIELSKCDLCNKLEDKTRLEFYGYSEKKRKVYWACKQCRLARWGYD